MSPRPYVTKLESCIKGGVVAQPGRKTLILGPNGSGKSARVNALEAAGSGKVSDVAGRAILALDADLSMLAHASKVWSIAKLSDGAGDAAWELERGHRAKRTGPEISFPLREVRAAILGSPETARRWILEMAGAFGGDEVQELVPESLHTRLGAVMGVDDGTGPRPSERLVAALEIARKRVREANAAAKASRAVTAPPGPPPSDDEIAKLEGIIRAWQARGNGSAALDRLHGDMKLVRENADRLTRAIAEHENEIAAIGPITPTTALRRAAVDVITSLAKSGASTCPICGCGCNPATITKRAEIGAAKIAEEGAKAKRKLDLEFALREATTDLAAARREISRLEAEETRLAKLGDPTGPAPEISRADAQVQLRGAIERRAGWATYRRAEERALELERESTEWAQLADALSKALGVLVEKARTAFEARVQRFLPSGDVFGIDLLDGEREVLRVGLRRPEGLDCALSGAEWARVTAALALATAPSEGPCVVVPEERAFDPATLASVLETWDKALPGDDAPQLVMTSPVAPERIPAGWTVIRLDEPAAKAPNPDRAMPELDPKDPLTADVPKRRGRPRGAKNKPKGEPTTAPETMGVIEFRPTMGPDGQMKLEEVPGPTEDEDLASLLES